MLCDGKTIDAGHGMSQENWQVLRRQAKSGRRQGHSTVGLSWSHHERRSLPQGVDHEAAGGGVVVRRERGLYAAVKTASEGLGIQSVAKGFGNIMQTESALGCLGNDVPGQSQGLGRRKHVDMQNLWMQEASKSGRFTTKKVDTSVNPADLMAKPVPMARIEQLMSLMSYEFVDKETFASKGQPTTTQKDSYVHRDSHIKAELGAKGTAEAFAKAADYSDDRTCFMCATNAVLRARKVEVR